VFPGLGTPRYIAESGTVFLDGDWTDDTIVGLRPAGLSETLACYAFTSDRFAIPALRALLPIKPDGASQCNRCEDANGWMRLPTVDGGTHQILWMLRPRMASKGALGASPRRGHLVPAEQSRPIERAGTCATRLGPQAVCSRL